MDPQSSKLEVAASPAQRWRVALQHVIDQGFDPICRHWLRERGFVEAQADSEEELHSWQLRLPFAGACQGALVLRGRGQRAKDVGIVRLAEVCADLLAQASQAVAEAALAAGDVNTFCLLSCSAVSKSEGPGDESLEYLVSQGAFRLELWRREEDTE